MKKMSCRQLGGACDLEFRANTFEEMSKLSQKHAREMFAQGEKEHLKAMSQMADLMKKDGAMDAWMNEKRAAFEALPSVE